MNGFEQFMGNPLTHMGIGLLSAPNIGQGLSTGLLSYQQQQNAMARQAQLGLANELARQRMTLVQQEAEREQQQEQMTREWVANNAPELSGLPIDVQMKVMESRLAPSAANVPADIQIYEYMEKLPPEKQERFLLSKRGPNWLNLGDRYMPAPMIPSRQPTTSQQGNVRIMDYGTGAPEEWATARQDLGLQPRGYAIQPKRSEMPEFRARQIQAVEEAKIRTKSKSEKESELSQLETQYPRLLELTEELSKLGKVATYTKAGIVTDEIKRQLGLDVGAGAIARKEYISKVDNEILPLLKQTFGSQFTEREGQSLKATLGDPDASPAEKDAVLRSFIQTKYNQARIAAKRAGRPLSTEVVPPTKSNVIDFSDLPE